MCSFRARANSRAAIFRDAFFIGVVTLRADARSTGPCNPPSYAAFEAWARAYEDEAFRYHEANRRVGAATRDLFASWYPAPLAPLVRQAVYALLDDAMLEAFGFPRPLPGMRGLVDGALRLRGRILRQLPPRREPCFFTHRPNRTHPQGYAIGALGPERLIAADRARPTDAPARRD